MISFFLVLDWKYYTTVAADCHQKTDCSESVLIKNCHAPKTGHGSFLGN